jgi:hypothetical protein
VKKKWKRGEANKGGGKRECIITVWKEKEKEKNREIRKINKEVSDLQLEAGSFFDLVQMQRCIHH